MKKSLLSLTLSVLLLTNILFSVALAESSPDSSDKEILQVYYDVFNNTQYEEYALYDIDKDGFPELLLSTNPMVKYSECQIYTYSNGKITHLGTQTIVYGIYEYDDRGILFASGGAGLLVYNRVYIKNNTLVEDEKTPYLGRHIEPYIKKFTHKGYKITEARFEKLQKNLVHVKFSKVFKLENSIRVIVDGKELSFDQPPVMINDRVMVPIKTIFEELNYNVEWDNNNYCVIITSQENS